MFVVNIQSTEAAPPVKRKKSEPVPVEDEEEKEVTKVSVRALTVSSIGWLL